MSWQLVLVAARPCMNCETQRSLVDERPNYKSHMASTVTLPLHALQPPISFALSVTSLQMLNNKLGRIDVEGTLHFYPRLRFLPFSNLFVPDSLPLHVTWIIVATGDDDKIISVTESVHNLFSVPRLLKALWTTLVTTAGLTVSSW